MSPSFFSVPSRAYISLLLFKAWITRNLPKLTPFVNHLLPSPESTITSLLPLTKDEISAMISAPSPISTPASPQQSTLLAQAKAVLGSYHSKLQKLVPAPVNPALNSQLIGNGNGKKAKPMGSTNQASLAALKALSGNDPTANETGPVTRLDRNGNEWSLKTRGA